MKRLGALALIVMVVSLFAAAPAFADAFNVTSNFGVRVNEKGPCEQIGSITLTPQVTSPNPGFDFWAPGTVITVELLAGATICDAVNQVLNTPGLLPYRVLAEVGDDFFTITNISGSNIITQIRVGDVTQGHAPICFNLVNTPYNSTDPNLQLVQVSYRDNQSNTYSGDTAVATVKPQAHTITVCDKDDIQTAYCGEGNLSCLSDYDTKTGLPQIPLCDPGATPSQDQDQIECGDNFSTVRACLTLSDQANVFGGRDYGFTLSITKAGVGIRDVQVCDGNGACSTVSELALTRFNANGQKINVAGGSATLEQEVDTKKVEFVEALQPGTNFVTFTVAYDSCTVTPGALQANLAVNLDPCGDSFSTASARTVAQLITCGDGMEPVSSFQYLFPYSVEPTGTGWFSGVSFVNLNNSSIDVALQAYEADGDLFTASVSIAPKSLVAVLVQTINWTAQGNDAQFGDERFWLLGSCPAPFSGVLFFGDGNMSMAYIPVLLNDSVLYVPSP